MASAFSASVQVTIEGTVHTLLAVYPHGTAFTQPLDSDQPPYADIVLELRLVREWFYDFNRDVPDTRGNLPRSTRSFPAATMLVTGNFHTSDSSPDERKHISGRLSTAEDWALEPRQNRCCVHIYARNDRVEEGYEGWFQKNKNRNTLQSHDIIAKVNAALNNNLGMLGQGVLV